MDQAFVDFDGVRYHLSTPDRKTQLLLSIDWRCFNELVTYGAQDVLSSHYAAYITATEPDYSFSLAIDLEALPSAPEDRTALIESFSLLKRNCLAAPFERAFDLQKQLEANPPESSSAAAHHGSQGQGQELMSIHYRPEEAIYIVPGMDRVTVVFSTIFKEETDRIFGKVFLQVRRFPFLLVPDGLMESVCVCMAGIRGREETASHPSGPSSHLLFTRTTARDPSFT